MVTERLSTNIRAQSRVRILFILVFLLSCLIYINKIYIPFYLIKKRLYCKNNKSVAILSENTGIVIPYLPTKTATLFRSKNVRAKRASPSPMFGEYSD